MRQVQIDLEAAEKIGSQQPVERSAGDVRQGNGADQHPEIGEGRRTEAQGVQPRIAADETASETVHRPCVLVMRLDAELLCRNFAQNGPFGAGIDEEGCSRLIDAHHGERDVAHARDRDFGLPLGPALRAGTGGSPDTEGSREEKGGDPD